MRDGAGYRLLRRYPMSQWQSDKPVGDSNPRKSA
uniref:Uncharacterized protein n=1 Tax=Ralstonia syzygii R24 TaxID=907261 RepID=G2ZZ92_9RALS|nr:hypothetical protein RALSY_10146 [Ralstonia syzygii R24]